MIEYELCLEGNDRIWARTLSLTSLLTDWWLPCLPRQSASSSPDSSFLRKTCNCLGPKPCRIQNAFWQTGTLMRRSFQRGYWKLNLLPSVGGLPTLLPLEVTDGLLFCGWPLVFFVSRRWRRPLKNRFCSSYWRLWNSVLSLLKCSGEKF